MKETEIRADEIVKRFKERMEDDMNYKTELLRQAVEKHKEFRKRHYITASIRGAIGHHVPMSHASGMAMAAMTFWIGN